MGHSAEEEEDVPKTSTRTAIFETTPDALVALLTSASFQEEQRRLDESVVDVKFVEISRTDARLEFELRSTEYERGLTGVNKNKHIQSVTHVEWDLKNRKGTWSYKTQAYDRFKLSGVERVEPMGDKARFVDEVTADMKMPLVGGKIEGAVLDGTAKGAKNWDALVRKRIGKP
jgi:hypothetical protein